MSQTTPPVAAIGSTLGHVLLSAQVPGAGPSFAAAALDADVIDEVHEVAAIS